MDDPPPPFVALLRRFRQAASLTQEDLAERAYLSARAINDLERGVRRAPRKDTVRLLAEGQTLSGSKGARPFDITTSIELCFDV